MSLKRKLVHKKLVFAIQVWFIIFYPGQRRKMFKAVKKIKFFVHFLDIQNWKIGVCILEVVLDFRTGAAFKPYQSNLSQKKPNFEVLNLTFTEKRSFYLNDMHRLNIKSSRCHICMGNRNCKQNHNAESPIKLENIKFRYKRYGAHNQIK